VTTDLIKATLLKLLPTDGSTVGNTSLRRALEAALASEGVKITEEDYWSAQTALIEEGYIATGKGRGGSVKLIKEPEGGFVLNASTAKSESEDKVKVPKAPPPARATSVSNNEPPQIISYRHPDKRVNNPEVGMVNTATDPEAGKTKWAYDPHLDPTLQFDPQRGAIETLIDDALASGDNQRMKDALEELKRLQSPYLNWAGKAERTSFEIDTVSLHVHERIDPASILSAVRKAMQGEGKSKGAEKAIQAGLFDAPFESLPLRDAIDFYRHERGWANRLIAGDSLLVMNSMLQKESMAGKVQMIYIDPPYGIKYGSNFQPFVGKRDVKDRTDADLTQEPEMIKAFRDTWELGIHSYLTYLRDRLVLARNLLNETGSIFVQISDDNLHHVREIMDEIFGPENFTAQINFRSMSPLGQTGLAKVYDYIVWYGKDAAKQKYHSLYKKRSIEDEPEFCMLDNGGGTYKRVTQQGLVDLDSEQRSKIFKRSVLTSSGYTPSCTYKFNALGAIHQPLSGKSWRTHSIGMSRLVKANRIIALGENPYFKQFHSDFSLIQMENSWLDTAAGYSDQKVYVVQTSDRVIERCMLMCTDPGDLVFDPTCGSGTSAYTAEKWGRRWISCDTSRVAITLAKQRLMTSSFDYYELKYPNEGLKSGFIYATQPHITLGGVANNPEIDVIYDRMHPLIESELESLNFELRIGKAPPFTPNEGVRKGEKIDFKNDQLNEWEVPFDWQNVWPAPAKNAFENYHNARIRMQQKINESVSAHAEQETLYDQPKISKNRLRITGPFTVEAVPFPSVKSLDEANGPEEADVSIARTGESGRQHQWRDELLKTGIRGKGGQLLKFSDLEPLPFDAGIRNLHAIGHLETGERVVVSFGPEHAALEQRQVESAKNEASDLFPTPKMIVFCAFTFDPEAAKDIDGIKGITALKAQMNTDLLTEDLKKARSSNQSFWLMGQPEIEVRTRKDGQYEVEVHGFDYFDTVKGELISGGKSKIAMWSLDTDYDERSLFPRQVFFPLSGKGEGWEKLKKNIRAELDESRLHQYQGTVSLPFESGDNRKIAVKIVDDRGIESLKVIAL
jgi:adenine-specific DNA-methyltransferase